MSVSRQIPFRSFLVPHAGPGDGTSRPRRPTATLKVIPEHGPGLGRREPHERGQRQDPEAGRHRSGPRGQRAGRDQEGIGSWTRARRERGGRLLRAARQDEKGRVGEPSFVAVADEKEFLGNFEVVKAGEKINEVKPKTEGSAAFNRMIACAFRNGYALLAPKSDRGGLEAALEAKQDISAEMAGLESWLAENDGTVVGTAAGIKFAAKQAGEELKKVERQLPPRRTGDRPLLRSYPGSLRQGHGGGAQRISLALAGIRCDKQGSIRIIGRARLVSGGQVSKAVAGIPPVTENLLCRRAGRSVRLRRRRHRHSQAGRRLP